MQLSGLGALSTGMDYTETPVAKACYPSARGTTEVGLRRLTKPELIASFKFLFGASIVNDQRVQAALQQIPEQPVESNSAFDNAIVDVAGLEAAAEALSTVTFETQASINTVLGGCGNVNDTVACTNALISSFGLKAFRRPLPGDVETSIRSLVSTLGGAEGLRNGVVRILISPYFSQHVEMGVDAENASASTIDVNAPLKLTPYEVASRLSFQLTGAPPDQTLLDAAKANQLATLDQVRAQALRLVQTPEARTNFRRLLSDWLNLKSVTDPSDVVAKSYGFSAAGFGAEALNEFLSYAEYEAFDKKNTFLGLMTDPVVIASTDRMAAAYGVKKSTAAQLVSNGLGGLILRPAVLMSASTTTSPILRGVFVQKKILCTTIPSPDASLVASRMGDLEAVSRLDFSNREVVEKVTATQTCIGCHSLINPIGFAMENLGPAGFPRKIETVYDAQGNTLATHPIDTQVSDLKIYSNMALPSPDAVSMLGAVARSARAQQCFESQLISNTHYRQVDLSDGCTINEMDQLQASNKSVIETLVQNAANAGIFWKSAKGLQ